MRLKPPPPGQVIRDFPRDVERLLAALVAGNTRASLFPRLLAQQFVADYVVEAVLEDLPLKQKLFAEIERHAPPRTFTQLSERLKGNVLDHVPGAA